MNVFPHDCDRAGIELLLKSHKSICESIRHKIEAEFPKGSTVFAQFNCRQKILTEAEVVSAGYTPGSVSVIVDGKTNKWGRAKKPFIKDVMYYYIIKYFI